MDMSEGAGYTDRDPICATIESVTEQLFRARAARF